MDMDDASDIVEHESVMALGAAPERPVATPLAAIDLPRRVPARIRGDGGMAVAVRPIQALPRGTGVPAVLAVRPEPAQRLLVEAVAS